MKVQLATAVNFICSRDNFEEEVMQVLAAYDNANEVIEEIFESLLSRYQTGLETSIRALYEKQHIRKNAQRKYHIFRN